MNDDEIRQLYLNRKYRDYIEERRKGQTGRVFYCKFCNQKIHTSEMFKHMIEIHNDKNTKAIYDMIRVTQFALFGKADWDPSDFITDEQLDAVKKIMEQREHSEDLR